MDVTRQHLKKKEVKKEAEAEPKKEGDADPMDLEKPKTEEKVQLPFSDLSLILSHPASGGGQDGGRPPSCPCLDQL